MFKRENPEKGGGISQRERRGRGTALSCACLACRGVIQTRKISKKYVAGLAGGGGRSWPKKANPDLYRDERLQGSRERDQSLFPPGRGRQPKKNLLLERAVSQEQMQ